MNLLSVRGLTIDFVSAVLSYTDHMKELVTRFGGDDRLKRKVIALLFCEPSTRTRCSFQAAVQRLGGSVILVEGDGSSMKKGETLQDTTQTLACYCDLIVIRHPEKGSAQTAAQHSRVPVINAGDGTGEHPTQALLDMHTIQTELGSIGGEDQEHPMVIALVGDLKHGRTVHSLVVLLALYAHVKLVLVSPAGLEMPHELLDEVQPQLSHQVEHMALSEAIVQADVLYVTRIQKERFTVEGDYEAVLGSYCVDAALMRKAKEKMIVMHPLPRVGEIHSEVDGDPRAAYFRQMEYGMYVRMALLDMLLPR